MSVVIPFFCNSPRKGCNVSSRNFSNSFRLLENHGHGVATSPGFKASSFILSASVSVAAASSDSCSTAVFEVLSFATFFCCPVQQLLFSWPPLPPLALSQLEKKHWQTWSQSWLSAWAVQVLQFPKPHCWVTWSQSWLLAWALQVLQFPKPHS